MFSFHFAKSQFSTSEYITWNKISVTDVYQRGQVPIIITMRAFIHLSKFARFQCIEFITKCFQQKPVAIENRHLYDHQSPATFFQNIKEKKDMYIITNVDAINSQIIYSHFHRYGFILSFILVNHHFMLVCCFHNRWTKYNWYLNRLQNSE